ncbi:MAG: hypothetical protein IPL86_07270 [Flavobacteriales bacterium]|nr:hypothetical protein [Flavobacteriales bacterium]
MLLEEAYQSGNFSNDVGELTAEEDIVLGKLRNLAAYHVLYANINYVFRSGGYVRTPEEHAIVEEISDHPLIKGKNTALSDRAASICLYTQGFCFWARRDWDTSYAKFKRAKEILDNRPVLRRIAEALCTHLLLHRTMRDRAWEVRQCPGEHQAPAVPYR